MSELSIPKLKYLCFGVGAIGTYIGGSLLLADQKVVFLERPGLAEDIRKNGLKLKLPDGEHRIEKPVVVPSLEEALTMGPYDVAICAVKSYDTDGLIEMIRPFHSALPVFLCLQNGVENEPKLETVLGEGRVIAGSVTTAVGRRGVGDIVLERLRGIGIAGDHPLVPALSASFEVAGLKSRIYSDPGSMKWSKMLTNLLANASSAILDMSPAEIFRNPGLYQVELNQIKETLAVMDRLKFSVISLPGTPVGLLISIMKNFPPALSRPLLFQSLGKGRGGKMPSFHIDLYSGRGKSEVGYLNGAVVRAGEELGIPTPVNRNLTDLLLKLTSGEIAKEEFAHQPQRFIERVL